MNSNENKATEPCPCCGSHLTATHAVGCPREHVQWFYADGRQMSEKNAELLMELAGVLNEKGIQG